MLRHWSQLVPNMSTDMRTLSITSSIYCGKTQQANFRGKLHCQATKQHTNNSLIKGLFYHVVLVPSVWKLILLNIGHQNNITKQLNQKQVSALRFICHRLTVKCCFVASKNGLSPKIRMLCFVTINECFWTFYVFGSLFHS